MQNLIYRYIVVEVDELIVIEQLIRIGNVSSHCGCLFLGPSTGFVVHPVQFINDFIKNSSKVLDHFVYCLTGRFFKMFTNVHGSHSIAQTVIFDTLNENSMLMKLPEPIVPSGDEVSALLPARFPFCSAGQYR